MKLTVCDICRAEPAAPIRLRNGNTQSGPDGMEDCIEYFELCLEHMADYFKELCKHNATQEKVCAQIKRRTRNND